MLEGGVSAREARNRRLADASRRDTGRREEPTTAEREARAVAGPTQPRVDEIREVDEPTIPPEARV